MRNRKRRGRRRRRNREPLQEKDNKLYLKGRVVEHLRNNMFKVVAKEGLEVLAHVCGKMRRSRIKVVPGDVVKLEFSPYDTSRARITFRHHHSEAFTI
ncbi:MAG: translation initiation factor IF-1 [Myxococcota bacterium]